MTLVRIMVFMVMTCSSLNFYAMDGESFGMFEADGRINVTSVDSSLTVPTAALHQDADSAVANLITSLGNARLLSNSNHEQERVSRRIVKAPRQAHQNNRNIQINLPNLVIVEVASVATSGSSATTPLVHNAAHCNPQMKRALESYDSDDIDLNRRFKPISDSSDRFSPVHSAGFIEVQSGRRSQSF